MSYLLLGLMLLLFLLGMPIVLAIGFCALVYAAFISRRAIDHHSPADGFRRGHVPPSAAVPMFILTGALMERCDITGRLVTFSQSLVGWLRGGLAQVNVVTNVIMSGISGSGLADAAATGTALIPVIEESGLRPGLLRSHHGVQLHHRPHRPTLDHHGRHRRAHEHFDRKDVPAEVCSRA